MVNVRNVRTHVGNAFLCAAALAWMTASFAEAQTVTTPYWYDGFNTGTSSFDINIALSARQGGAPKPISYVANTRSGSEAASYHEQIAGPTSNSVLQLAGDANAGLPHPDPSLGITMVSPVFNFSSLIGSDVVGRAVTFDLNVGSGATSGTGKYIQAGISIGGTSTLTLGASSAPHFHVRFVEDTRAVNTGLQYFLQLFDGNTLVQNLIPNPAGGNAFNGRLNIDDPVDGNPWNGVGSTVIDVLVSGSLVGSYTKGGGGYTSNFLTLEGSSNKVTQGLVTHTFDNLTVHIAPVPEPSAAVLLGLGLGGMFIASRRRR